LQAYDRHTEDVTTAITERSLVDKLPGVFKSEPALKTLETRIREMPEFKGLASAVGDIEFVRDILSNAPTSGSQKYFNETIAPPLLKFGMISKDQADNLYTQLGQIESGRMPEQAKLSIRQKLILDAMISYSSSVGSGKINQAGFSLVNLIPR
jgi:hypothetical protein